MTELDPSNLGATSGRKGLAASGFLSKDDPGGKVLRCFRDFSYEVRQSTDRPEGFELGLWEPVEGTEMNGGTGRPPKTQPSCKGEARLPGAGLGRCGGGLRRIPRPVLTAEGKPGFPVRMPGTCGGVERGGSPGPDWPQRGSQDARRC